MNQADDFFQPDQETRSKYDEGYRMLHLCTGALEGLCSITIREDVRKRSVEATTAIDPFDPNLVRAAYAMADEVDLWSPDSVEQVHGVMYADSPGMREGAHGELKELFDACFMSNLPMSMLAAIAHNGILRIRPFEEGNGIVARMWYSELLGRSFKTFQYISPEAEFLRTREEYEALVARPEDIKGFVDYSLDCDREALSRLFGTMW